MRKVLYILLMAAVLCTVPTVAEAQAVYDLLTADPTTLSSGLSFWDQLAAVTLVESAVATWQELDVTVLQQGGPESAGTLAAGMGRPATVAMAADREAFESEYLTTLTGEDVAASEWDADATLTISDAGWEYGGPVSRDVRILLAPPGRSRASHRAWSRGPRLRHNSDRCPRIDGADRT